MRRWLLPSQSVRSATFTTRALCEPVTNRDSPRPLPDFEFVMTFRSHALAVVYGYPASPPLPRIYEGRTDSNILLHVQLREDRQRS